MKRPAWAFGAVFLVAIVAKGISQSNAGSSEKADVKRLITTLPGGEGGLRLTAMSIDRDWNPPVTHLRGQVEVEIWTTPRNARHVTTLRADEADYYENTGEIAPRGHVRVTVGAVR